MQKLEFGCSFAPEAKCVTAMMQGGENCLNVEKVPNSVAEKESRKDKDTYNNR